MKVTDEMVNRFLAWPLPKSVRPDACASEPNYPHRVGTHLLTGIEARAMLEHVLGGIPPRAFIASEADENRCACCGEHKFHHYVPTGPALCDRPPHSAGGES